jgi:hypothetical protein
MLAKEGFLWCRPTTVTQQAMSQRFLSFPAPLFEGVFKNLLPSLRTAWYQRTQRPLPDRQRGQSQFFFETSSQTPLTTAIQA